MKNIFNLTSLGLVILIILLFYIYYTYFKINEGFTNILPTQQLNSINMDKLNQLGKYVKSVKFTHDPSLKQNSQKCTENNSIHCNIIFQNLSFIMNGVVLDMNNYANIMLPNLVKIDIAMQPVGNTTVIDFSNIFTHVNSDGSKYTGVPFINFVYFILDYLENGVTSISISGNGETYLIGNTLPEPPKITLNNIDITIDGEKTISKIGDLLKKYEWFKNRGFVNFGFVEKEISFPNQYVLVDFFNLLLCNVYEFNTVTKNSYNPPYYLIANGPIPTTSAPIPTMPSYASNPFSEHTYSNPTFLNYS